MKKTAFIILLFFVSFFLRAEKKTDVKEKWEFVQKTEVAERISDKILVDGKLNENSWKREPITGFTQNDPDEGKPATEKTEVWVGYDDHAIYIAARLHDSEPDKIISLLARRDNFVEADYFLFYVDPYYDRRSGFRFAVNPSGSIVDWKLYNDGWSDSSWDGVWEAKTSIDENGWATEMRIPFDQLRFKKKNNGDEYTWGINFRRYIRRKNEIAAYSWIPKTESGYVSRFAKLTGIKEIDPKRLFEVTPYTVAKANFSQAEEGNPFKTGSEYYGNAGLDIKLGLTNSLTLDLTANPDFGQVEVDPAVINLSAAESYYSERRPFFVEGSHIFNFGRGGASNRIGANWGDPRLFHSRRIGRAPQGYVDTDGYTEYPEWSSILTAAKLSGKIGNGWNIGVLTAFTEREYAQIDLDGVRSEGEVEPFANYTVLRAQKEFNEGRQGLGFIATSVLRELKSNGFSDIMNKEAYSYGVDGWSFLDKKKVWVVTGYLGGTQVVGTKERINDLQQSYPHYYQRPDNDYSDLDENATSLGGYTGRFMLNKEKGNFMLNAAFGFISPGFDARDMGFQWGGDVFNGHVMVGYRSYKKWKFIRNWRVNLLTQRNYNFGGDKIGEQRLIVINSMTFTNFWSFYWQWSHNPDTWDSSRTRGGPMMKLQNHDWVDWWVNSDGRKPFVFGFGSFHLLSDWGRSLDSVSANLRWKPGSNFNMSLSPRYEKNYNNSQWVGNFEDPVMTHTYGTRYIFGDLEQDTLSLTLRLNWIFTPKLSLQAYIQPFIAVGRYRSFAEFAEPRTYNFNQYGVGNSTILYNNDEYTVNPGDGGEQFTFGNPDFNYKSLRGTVVLRWEYRLGSTLYLVWTQNRADFNNPGDFSMGRDFSNMLSAPGDNIFMLKFTYRFKM
ncbi:MAG: DUF5916 domain-containing protein [Acidobacteriota bacterium]